MVVLCVFERLENEKVAIPKMLFAILYYDKAKYPLFAGKMDSNGTFPQLLSRFKAVFNQKQGGYDNIFPMFANYTDQNVHHHLHYKYFINTSKILLFSKN